jgi:hypothetical protein
MRGSMKILKFLPGSIALACGAAIMVAPSASADPYCYSFGLFATCVEVPSYNTPPPKPLKPLPIWVCKSVSTATAVMTLIPGGTIQTWVARIIFIPTLTCYWD